MAMMFPGAPGAPAAPAPPTAGPAQVAPPMVQGEQPGGAGNPFQALANQVYLQGQQIAALQQTVQRLLTSKVNMAFQVYRDSEGRIHTITATEGYQDG